MTPIPPASGPALSALPGDYATRVYAGLLGKIIGVYLGRPVEGWTFERISARFGEINYYIHEALNVPLVVTDDDITGTLAFLRAVEDSGRGSEFTVADVAETWLNTIVEGRTILWWGGRGLSTEHTAYLNLKAGIPAPESGSIAVNGRTVAEQIGAQIFVDAFAMLCPGDPQRAADFAERAARVSHDGEAVQAARVLAAMEAAAFGAASIDELLDVGLSVIPAESTIARLVRDLREWRTLEPDWRAARRLVEEQYGYARYPGSVHVVPNHALIILALLYGEGDFQKSLAIVTTSGWDTDCNAGNLGCLLGLLNGLDGLDTGPDWRSPVADRLLLPTAEGGRAITDVAREALWIANLGRRLRGLDEIRPKGGARFHFELPGSVQGFEPASEPDARGTTRLSNQPGHSRDGTRSLALECAGLARGRSARVTTATFSPKDALARNGQSPYDMLASPILHPGQQVSAQVQASADNPQPLWAAVVIEHAGPAGAPARTFGPARTLMPGEAATLELRVPDLNGQPVERVGLQLDSPDGRRAEGTVFLDWLDWTGAPEAVLSAPDLPGHAWRDAWVNAVDRVEEHWGFAHHLIQNRGRGLASQGTRQWTDYRATATLETHLARACGLAVRAQGLRRYYALLLVPGAARLVRVLGEEDVLAEAPFDWAFSERHELSLEAHGPRLRAWLDGTLAFDLSDASGALTGGAVGLVIEEGALIGHGVRVAPSQP